MNEAELYSMAYGASSDLSNLSHDVLEIKAILISLFSPDDGIEVAVPERDEVATYSVDLQDTSEEAPDYMPFLWCGLVVQIFILVAVLLNLGVNLWKSFSDKWRV